MNRLLAIAAISSSLAIGIFQQSAAMAVPYQPKDSECQWLSKDGTFAGTLYKCQAEYDSSGLIMYMKWKDGQATTIGRNAGWTRVGKNCFYHSHDGEKYRICDVDTRHPANK